MQTKTWLKNSDFESCWRNMLFAIAKSLSQFTKFARGKVYIQVNLSTNQEAQKSLKNKPAWRSSIWMSINVIFTPATANGYSHNALSPFCLQRSSSKDFCTESASLRWMKGQTYKNINITYLNNSIINIMHCRYYWRIISCSIFKGGRVPLLAE